MALGWGMEKGLVVEAVMSLGVDGMQPMMLYVDSLRCLKVGDAGK